MIARVAAIVPSVPLPGNNMNRRLDRVLPAISLLLLVLVAIAGFFAHQLSRRHDPPDDTVHSWPVHVCPNPIWAGWNMLCGCGPFARKEPRDAWRFHGW